MLSWKSIRLVGALCACAAALLTLSGTASSYDSTSPEGRLAQARAELIGMRGTMPSAAERLWLSRAVASLGWAIDGKCWSSDGTRLQPETGARCLEALRTTVRRLSTADGAELRNDADAQIWEIVDAVGIVASTALADAETDVPPANMPASSALWKTQYEFIVNAYLPYAAHDAPQVMNVYIRAWLRLNGPGTPPAVTLGAGTLLPKLDYNPQGQAEAFEFTATGDALSTLSLYVDRASTANSLVAGVYADGEAGPGQLLAQGTTPLAYGGGDWNSVHFPRISLTPGSKYWVAILTPAGGGTLRFRDRCCRGAGSLMSVMSQETNLTSLPASWTAGARFKDGPLSLFGSD